MPKFVTPQISKLLKARGFDDPCIAYYTEVTERLYPLISDKPLINEFIEVTHKDIYETYSLAPTLLLEETYVNLHEIEYFTEEQKLRYLNKKAIDGDYLPTELFMMLDEYHKLRYILMIGLNEADNEVCEWYTAYEKATNRDKQITKILE